MATSERIAAVSVIVAIISIIIPTILYFDQRSTNKDLRSQLRNEKVEDESKKLERLLDKIIVLEKQYDGQKSEGLQAKTASINGKLSLLNRYFNNSKLHSKFWNDYKQTLSYEDHMISDLQDLSAQHDIAEAMKTIQIGGHGEIKERFYTTSTSIDENIKYALGESRKQEELFRSWNVGAPLTDTVRKASAISIDELSSLAPGVDSEIPVFILDSSNTVKAFKESHIKVAKINDKRAAAKAGLTKTPSEYPVYITPDYRALALMGFSKVSFEGKYGLTSEERNRTETCLNLENREGAIKCLTSELELLKNFSDSQ